MQKLGFFRALTPLFVGSNPATPAKNAVVVVYTCNPSSQEAGGQDFKVTLDYMLSFRPAWDISQYLI